MKKRPASNAMQLLQSFQWAITREALDTMLAIVDRSNLSPDALEAQTGIPLDNTGERVTVRDGIATLSVRGPLFRYANFFTRVSGATAYATLARDFNAALSNADVRGIILDIDSPGGEVNGCNEFAGMVYAARGKKPITAYISGAGCSAAYWIASAADKIVASETSMIGSIGCIFTFVDYSGADKQAGIKRIEIVSNQSPRKAMDATKKEGQADLQLLADQLAQVFIDTVARNRGTDADTVLSDYGQGSVMVGDAAVAAGLADQLGSYETLHAAFFDEQPLLPQQETLMSAKSPAPAAATQPENNLPNPATTESATASTAAAAATSETAAASTSSETETPATAATPLDPAALERKRILDIQALGRAGEEKLIAECIADATCTVEAAALRLRAAENTAGKSRLAAIAGDEEKTQAPRPLSPDATEQGTPKALAREVLAVHARVTTPSRSR